MGVYYFITSGNFVAKFRSRVEHFKVRLSSSVLQREFDELGVVQSTRRLCIA
jgi:hypothetical protein